MYFPSMMRVGTPVMPYAVASRAPCVALDWMEKEL